jgi:2-polyprenyl-3-methyl-5-hydroxy-6-metoxy-1,4-benzoquinol methylase
MTTVDDRQLQESQLYWNQEAATFDNEPDHGLRDPIVYDAWNQLFSTVLPTRSSRILDIGRGTGSISLLLARLGLQATGIDLSPAVIEHARAKAKTVRQPINFLVMDASNPTFSPRQFDAIVCRQILWALPEPAQVLQCWVG